MQKFFGYSHLYLQVQVPLGTIVTSSESESIFYLKINSPINCVLWAWLLKPTSLPHIIDDADSEFKAFKTVFPEAIHLLCQFHFSGTLISSALFSYKANYELIIWTWDLQTSHLPLAMIKFKKKNQANSQ